VVLLLFPLNGGFFMFKEVLFIALALLPAFVEAGCKNGRCGINRTMRVNKKKVVRKAYQSTCKNGRCGIRR
jgi:hypothetical protein